MKLTSPGLWIGIASTIGVALLAVNDFERVAPGPISSVHSAVPELAGAEDCNQCHGGWGESMADACMECHGMIRDQVLEDRGLHGVVAASADLACGLCHGEHHGADWGVVNAQSFAMAGAGSREEFDHAFVGFEMAGQHLELDCTECHENADVPVLDAGMLRFNGLDRDCASCHEDNHRGQMVVSCTSCHGQESFDRLESSGHDRFLALTGGHGQLDCADCHDRTAGPHSLRQLGHGTSIAAARSCVDCHESPHRQGFLRRVASAAELAPAESCRTCHLEEHESFRDGREPVDAEAHALTGFRLDAPHDRLDCSDCHGEEELPFAEAHPGRRAENCRACHESPHGGQFAPPGAEARECTACHEPLRFEPHAFTVERHAETDLALTGSHLELECSECHADPLAGEPRAFATLDAACEACHEDGHGGFFDGYLARVTRQRRSEGETLAAAVGCEQCHESTDFAEVDLERFHHGQATGLQLTGAHLQTDCESCHPRAEEPDDLGRTLGFVSEHFGEFTGCTTCHDDPHQGRFDRPGRPRVVEGRRDCARCHSAVSFRVLRDSFDHATWTQYPLDGEHAKLACAACHEPLARPDEEGRTWLPAAGTSCSDCHADPHGGQFAVEGAIDCERCHQDTSAFAELAFRHDRDSDFKLGEAHRALECSACHFPIPTPSGAELIRYRPIDSECADCHGTQEERDFLGRRKRR